MYKFIESSDSDVGFVQEENLNETENVLEEIENDDNVAQQ